MAPWSSGEVQTAERGDRARRTEHAVSRARIKSSSISGNSKIRRSSLFSLLQFLALLISVQFLATESDSISDSIPGGQGLFGEQELFAVEAIHVEIMVASAWKSQWRRNKLRDVFDACRTAVTDNRDNGLKHREEHKVTYHFFLGDPDTVQPDEDELRTIGKHDMIRLGGPDMDPPVKRDIT
jgi:hypothetical protein